MIRYGAHNLQHCSAKASEMPQISSASKSNIARKPSQVTPRPFTLEESVQSLVGN